MELRNTYNNNNSQGSLSNYSSFSPNFSYQRGSASSEIRGADIIAEYLLKENVPIILGYAGHGAIGLLDSIFKHQDKIRHIQPRPLFPKEYQILLHYL